ncbi:MAG TPA: glycosyltransferase family 87 protein [Flexivirga sp.]|uniref:glycosyltransferase family 87 protein n=1 Tax=Flexivirga sp. TaxID=1962927 RepID=UPI002BAECFF3|nr:glycosyltransferase family 87 protein [Flexivirga sp.]HWC23428.1 glycosyltransferase family 87 protein [Flexivirga sp.]
MWAGSYQWSRGRCTRPVLAQIVSLGLVGGFVAVLARTHATYGMDSESIWYGARGLVKFRDPYHPVPGHNPFVYPPSCAVLAAPSALMTNRAFVAGMLVVNILALVGIGVACGRLMRVPRWMSTLLTAALMLSPLGRGTITFGNATVLVAALSAWALVCVESHRWATAACLIGLSLSIKPLAILLLLVLVASRRWRAVCGALLIPAVLNIVGLALVSDWSLLMESARKLAAGSLLPLQANASLWARGTSLHAAPALIFAVQASIVLIVLLALWWCWRRTDLVATGIVAIAPTICLFLVSRVDEPHYGLVSVILCAVLATTGRTLVTVSAGVVAAVLLFLPAGSALIADDSLASSVAAVAQVVLLLVAARLAMPAMAPDPKSARVLPADAV